MMLQQNRVVNGTGVVYTRYVVTQRKRQVHTEYISIFARVEVNEPFCNGKATYVIQTGEPTDTNFTASLSV